MDLSLKEVLQVATQGGSTVIVTIILMIIVKYGREVTKEAFSKHISLNEQLIQILKDDQEYKLHLAGIMDRLTVKLETPTQCPILIAGKKVRLEVLE